MENIGNKIFDNDLKINKSKLRLEELCKVTDDLNDQKLDTEKRVHGDIFKYDTRNILTLMGISESTIESLCSDVPNVYIYNIRRIVDEVFIIRFYVHNVEYEFKIINTGKRFNPIAIAFEDGVQRQTYDIKLEFIALDFEKVKMDKFLENYVNLLVKNNKNFKLGMIIIAYYYLIEYKQYKYKQYKNPEINIHDILPKSDVNKLTEIFRYDLTSYIFDNYSDDTYEKI